MDDTGSPDGPSWRLSPASPAGRRSGSAGPAAFARPVNGPRYPVDDLLRATFGERLGRFERRATRVPVGGARPPRQAAVALCVVGATDGEAALLLTQRAAGLRAHARQYALPGGRVDPGEDPVSAARRETLEEVGLDCPVEDVLGLLVDYPTRSGYVITPVVIWVPPGAVPVANPDEVAAIHRVPLAELDHPEAPRLLTIPESERPVIQMPVRGQWIHAPTAALLYQFREVVMHERPTRVAHFEQPVWAWR